MDRFKEYKYTILIILLILGFSFYWFEWKPAQIRKDCSNRASKWADIPTGESQSNYLEQVKAWDAGYDQIYKLCLGENGIEK